MDEKEFDKNMLIGERILNRLGIKTEMRNICIKCGYYVITENKKDIEKICQHVENCTC